MSSWGRRSSSKYVLRAGALCLAFALATLSLCLAFAMLSPASARAQAPAQPGAAAENSGGNKDKIAREMFNAGRTAYDGGLYEDALQSFRRAYELSKRPQLLFNVGQAADRARHDEEALQAFEQYLREVPDAENKEFVQGRIAILKKTTEKEAAPPAAPNLAVSASAAAPTAPASAPEGATQADQGENHGVLTKWWFWTAVGVGVAAIAVTAVALSSQDPTLQKGDVGGVVHTLRSAP